MANNRIQQLEEFLKTNPENALIQYSLGLEYLKAREAGKAILNLREAIRLQSDYSAAYRDLGKALALDGRSEEAVQTYRQGIEVAKGRGDLQTAKEMWVFLKRITQEPEQAEDSCAE
jgi:uncharacterized protein HemY